MKLDRLCITAYVPSQVGGFEKRYWPPKLKPFPTTGVLEAARKAKRDAGLKFVDGERA